MATTGFDLMGLAAPASDHGAAKHEVEMFSPPPRAGAALPLALAASLALTPAARAAPPPPPAAAATQAVDPAAVAAAKRMGEYLRTLTSFEVVSDAAVEKVLDEGDKATFAQRDTYKVRRPDAFFVETQSDRQHRRYFYDGRTFTVYAPRAGVFAKGPAPATIQATLAQIYKDFGIALPLADLFTWGVEESPPGPVQRAMHVGAAKLNGVDTDQYLFRGPKQQWQIWIERGARPLPRRVSIVTLDDPAKPAFNADLTWNTAVSFPPQTFAFQPPSSAKPIAMKLIDVEEVAPEAPLP